MALVESPDPVDLPSSDTTYESVASQVRGTTVSRQSKLELQKNHTLTCFQHTTSKMAVG
jgi:hypothetical protein